MSEWEFEDGPPPRMTARAWGGQLVAVRNAEGKWAMEWRSDDATLTIAAHVHYLDRFGLDPEQLRGAVGPAGAAELFATAASSNGAYALNQHLRQFYPADDRVIELDDPGPAPFLGDDPF